MKENGKRCKNSLDIGKRVKLVCSGKKGKTKQAFRDECDINILLKRYAKSGGLPLESKTKLYGDFSSVPTYMEACDIVARAEEQFMALDANIRARFQNNAAEFLGFCTNPQNLDEMVKLGLATGSPNSSDGGGTPKRAGEPSGEAKKQVIPVSGDAKDGAPPPKPGP